MLEAIVYTYFLLGLLVLILGALAATSKGNREFGWAEGVLVFFLWPLILYLVCKELYDERN